MDITIQYFDGCPNWETTRRVVAGLIEELGLDARLHLQEIETPQEAEKHGFRGSPTVLVDGVDPFADGTAPVGLVCRVYATERGPAGSPSPDQLCAVLSRSRSPGS